MKKKKPATERREKYRAFFHDHIQKNKKKETNTQASTHRQQYVHFSLTMVQLPFIYPVPSPHIPKPCANKPLAASTVFQEQDINCPQP